jgi:hypothetical protein
MILLLIYCEFRFERKANIYEALYPCFQPIKIGPLTAKNRIEVSPAEHSVQQGRACNRRIRRLYLGVWQEEARV